MTRFLLTIILLTSALYSRPILNIPGPISITQNDSSYSPCTEFLDSLVMLHDKNAFYYNIAGVHRDEYKIFTILRLPESLYLQDVIKQTILYYNFLPDENIRQEEELHIFPLFKDLNDPPALIARYNGKGKFDFTIYHWMRVPVPSAPSPEEKSLYNEVLNLAFKSSNSLDNIDRDIFANVAAKHRISIEQLTRLYQRILLWQRSPK